MLMRVRNQAKCVGTSALTSNLPVSLVFSSGIEFKSFLFFPELGVLDGVYPELSRRAQDVLCAFARDQSRIRHLEPETRNLRPSQLLTCHFPSSLDTVFSPRASLVEREDT